MKRKFVCAALMGLSMVSTDLYASDFTFRAACPKVEDVVKLVSQNEWHPQKIDKEGSKILKTISNKSLVTDEKKTKIHWEVTKVNVTNLYNLIIVRSRFRIVESYIVDDLSTYSPQSQVCAYNMHYYSGSPTNPSTLFALLTRLKEDV